MRHVSLALAGLALLASQALAAPSDFPYDKKQKPKVGENDLRGVYDLIPNPSGSAAKARLAILTAMLATRGVAWLLEEEGDGYVLARWDYKGHTIFHRIEYDARGLQIKYAGGLNAYQCANRVGDFCYKTHGHYYKYSRNLRDTIAAAL